MISGKAGVSPRFVKIALLLSVAASIAFSGKAYASEPEELFTSHPSATEADVLGQREADPTVVRERPVTINVQGLSSRADQTAVGLVAQPVSLNIFPDVRRYFIPEKTEKSRDGKFTILTGSIAGGRPMMNNATFVFGDGVVTGNIRPGWGSVIYQIRTSPSGIQTVQEVDTSKFPAERDPVPAPASAAPDAGGTAAPKSSPQGANTPAPVPDDGTTINVMVVYTPSARAAAGGTAAMQSLINLGVSETNQGYINSGVTQRITLAHSAEVAYTEGAGATGFDAALTDIAGTSDGKMDNVHTLRNTYAADMVSFWINNSAYCGLAYLMTTASASFESSAFSAVHYACATGYYSFGHEMGHNQGSHHDLYVAPENGVYPYSHGYVDTLNQFRTVMAYATACGACPRINYWSNPNVNYTARATGDANANNTLSLNNTISVAANWRSSTTGSLAVTIAPAGAVTDGALWHVDGGAWQASGAAVTGLSAGGHTVSFNTVTGWMSPTDQAVTITVGQTTTATGTYTQIFTVTATAGTGGAVTPKSRTVANSSTASFTVTPNAGYTTDSAVGGTCPAGSWDLTHTTYTTGAVAADCPVSFMFMPPGSLRVNISPVVRAVTAGARWRVDGGTWRMSGARLSGLAIGAHTVSFKAVTGWTSPADQAVSITSGQTATATGTYTLRVTPSAGTGGMVIQATPQEVNYGSTTSFTVTANAGYTANTRVGGTCAVGAWDATYTTYTTGAVTAACSVNFSFAPPGFHAEEVDITVIINPAQARADGARWSLDGGLVWHDSGHTVVGPKKYTIKFKDTTAGGWRTPRSVSSTTTKAVTLTMPYPHVVNDYENDGKSDLLFRSGTTGHLYEWNLDGAVVNGGAYFGRGPAATALPGTIVAQADFDGDGKTDLLFEDSSVAPAVLTMWIMKANGSVSASTVVTIANPARTTTEVFVGAADFDGDGKADILLVETAPGGVTTAALTPRILFMNGGVVTSQSNTKLSNGVTNLTIPQTALTAYALNTHSGWRVAALADFNGDGRADILWRSANTGQAVIWNMNGATRISTGNFARAFGAYRNTTGGAIPSGWLVVGVGDFNGDGHADIMLRNGATGGATAVWLLKGQSGAIVGKAANGRNTVDISLRGSGPAVDADGFVINTGAFTALRGWSVVGIGDFNGDGLDDLLWRYLRTGHTYVWLMNGRTATASSGFTTVYPGLVSTWETQIMRAVVDPQ